MKKFIVVMLSALIMVVGVTMVVVSPQVYAQQTPKEAACEGLSLSGGGENCQLEEGSPTLNSTLELVINILSFLVGFAAVLMIIIGGFKYVTSSGDSAGINSAKNTILFAIIGLVIVAVAQVIVRFVITRATNPPESYISQRIHA